MNQMKKNPSEAEIEQILNGITVEVHFKVNTLPEFIMNLGEAQQALANLLNRSRIDELNRIKDLGDGIGHLANHALTIGVYVEERLVQLQTSPATERATE